MNRKSTQTQNLFHIFEGYESLVNVLDLLKTLDADSSFETNELI
jgi:hypothetical protein